ncbi:MAG: ATP-binding cassette domain-containing protein, partial [Cyanobacteria bacterium P01_H01_bin.130]
MGQETKDLALALRGAGQRFSEAGWALRDIDLAIAPGECVALIGPTGAGKSTLLSWLNGGRVPTAGEVFVLGQSLNRLRSPQRRRLQQQVGTVYQQFHLINNLSVLHNVNAGNLGHWPLWKTLLSLLWPLN